MSEPCWLSTYLICNVGLLIKETLEVFRYFGTEHCLEYLTHAFHSGKEPSDLDNFKIEFLEQDDTKYLEFWAGSGIGTGSLCIDNTKDVFIANLKVLSSYSTWLTKLLEAIRLHKILLKIDACLTEQFGFKWKGSYGSWRHAHGYLSLFFAPNCRHLCINRNGDPIGKAWPIQLEPDLLVLGVVYPTLSEFMLAFQKWVNSLQFQHFKNKRPI